MPVYNHNQVWFDSHAMDVLYFS